MSKISGAMEIGKRREASLKSVKRDSSVIGIKESIRRDAFSRLSLEDQLEVIGAFKEIVGGWIAEFENESTLSISEHQKDAVKSDKAQREGVIEKREALDPNRIEYFESLANRERVEDPAVFARLVAEVSQMMGGEAKEEKSALVELATDRPTVVISELNGNRSALFEFLDKEVFGHAKDFEKEEFRNKNFFDLLKEDKINVVFTGNYTHGIGKIARERQRMANKLMGDSGKKGEKPMSMFDNPFQNGVMSDALNCLQMVLNLKKQFPANVTLLANSYELLLDRHWRDMGTEVRGVNENFTYVKWLKEYFGPDNKNIDQNISQMMFEQMHWPVLVVGREAGVIITPSVPNDFQVGKKKKPVVKPSEIILALRNAEPAAVDAMCSGAQNDLEKIQEFAKALKIDGSVLWVAARGRYALGDESESLETVTVTENEQVSLVRLNNAEGALGGYIVGFDKKSEEVSGQATVFAGVNQPKKEVNRSELFHKHAKK